MSTFIYESGGARVEGWLYLFIFAEWVYCRLELVGICDGAEVVSTEGTVGRTRVVQAIWP